MPTSWLKSLLGKLSQDVYWQNSYKYNLPKIHLHKVLISEVTFGQSEIKYKKYILQFSYVLFLINLGIHFLDKQSY